MDVPNAFIDKTTPPNSQELATALGQSEVLWNEIIDWFADELNVTDQEWKSSAPKYGWSLILSYKKRRIVYLIPCLGCFRASFIIGDRAVAAARQAGLSKFLLKLLDEAPHYPEGTGLRLTIKAARDLASIRKLAQIKLTN